MDDDDLISVYSSIKTLMDFAHLHLLITHLPVFGALLGAFVLAYGLFSKSYQTITASYWILLIASLGGVTSYLTGESAEEKVEHISGISKNMIESHEESAELTIVFLAILGVLALLALIVNLKWIQVRKPIALVVFAVSVVCFVLVARTAYLGGQIRHTEINQGSLDADDESH